MRLFFYFLIIINLAVLLLNWDKISTPKTTQITAEKQEAELVPANEDLFSLTTRRQQIPTIASPNTATRTIDKVWDFVADLWNLLKNLILPADGSLPTSTGLPEPKIPVPVATYCLDVGPFADAQTALTYKEILEIKRVTTELQRRETKTAQTKNDAAAQVRASYIVAARVRSDINTAKKLSDFLHEKGIHQQMKENSPLGYLLQAPVFHSENAAQRTLKKMQDLGLSAYMQQIKGTKKVTARPATSIRTAFYLRIAKPQIRLWEQLNQKENLRGLFEEGVRFEKANSC